VLGGATLLLAAWSLLAPRAAGRGAALRRASPALTGFYILWLLDAYAAAALGNLVEAPGALVTVGLWGFPDEAPPAAGPLLLQLLTCVAVAGLCRAETLAAGGGGSVGGAAAAAAEGAAAAAAAAAVEGADGGSPTVAGGGRQGSIGAAELLHLLHLRGEQPPSDGGAVAPGGRAGEEEDAAHLMWEAAATGAVQVRRGRAPGKGSILPPLAAFRRRPRVRTAPSS
jgi:hypothetical protein